MLARQVDAVPIESIPVHVVHQELEQLAGILRCSTPAIKTLVRVSKQDQKPESACVHRL